MKTQTRRPKTLFKNQRDITNHGKTNHETKHDIDFSRPVGSDRYRERKHFFERQKDSYENRHETECRTPKGRYEPWEDNA